MERSGYSGTHETVVQRHGWSVPSGCGCGVVGIVLCWNAGLCCLVGRRRGEGLLMEEDMFALNTLEAGMHEQRVPAS